MIYSLRLSHIGKDFSLDGDIEESWSTEVENPEEFSRILNRAAIASSQAKGPVVDFPEIEVTAGTRRVIITAISGELYYTDPRSPNRQNLKVVPDEVIRLLDNLPMDLVFGQDASDAESISGARVRYRKPASSRSLRSVLLYGLLAVMGLCVYSVWSTLSYQPELYARPDFQPAPEARAGEMLAEWVGVYVSEYREGGMAFELERNGQFRLYEIWFSREDGDFQLYPIQSSIAIPGSDGGGGSGFLIEGAQFLRPVDKENMVLQGVSYHRHFGSLSQLGKVAPVGER